MPRSFLRAACAVLAVVALVLAATPTSSKEEHWPAKPALFHAGPILNGATVASCAGTSPLQNVCEAFAGDDCSAGCGPDVTAGFAYSGRLTAAVFGKGSRGDDRYVSWSCVFVAGAKTRLGPVDTGPCQGGANAEVFCLPDCHYYMWPPFRLRADSTAGVGGAPPVGSWTARLVSG